MDRAARAAGCQRQEYGTVKLDPKFLFHGTGNIDNGQDAEALALEGVDNLGDSFFEAGLDCSRDEVIHDVLLLIEAAIVKRAALR